MEQETAFERFLKAAHKTVFCVDRMADRLLSEHSSGTFSQFLILTAIARHPGLSQREIAEFLNLTPAAVSRAVDSLVEMSIIVREHDPNSRRTHIVRLTKTGEEHYGKMKTLLLSTLQKKISDISLDELNSASATLEKTLGALDPECMKREQRI